MTTVDQLLTKLINKDIDQMKESISYRDVRVLTSLFKSITGPTFITENQGRLLLKIFTENQKKLSVLSDEFTKVLDAPLWSQPFRPADNTKKIYVATSPDDTKVLVAEFAFSSVIRKKISSLSKTLTGLVQTASGKQYQMDYTEKNIVNLIEGLNDCNFDIDETVKNHYNTIKSWNIDDIKNQFLLPSIAHEMFNKRLNEDIGPAADRDELVVNDRKLRYQYFLEKSEKIPENLEEIIANRSSQKVWIDKKITSLEEIMNSLLKLKRLPVMIVFDSYSPKTCATELEKISEILEKIGITDDVGIYFRLNNDAEGTAFNNLVKDKKYNCQLSASTKVVGVQSGKIPKFILKNDWKPMSVITIGTSLRHSKTAIYASCCDLIISYTDSEPIYETRNIWE